MFAHFLQIHTLASRYSLCKIFEGSVSTSITVLQFVTNIGSLIETLKIATCDVKFNKFRKASNNFRIPKMSIVGRKSLPINVNFTANSEHSIRFHFEENFKFKKRSKFGSLYGKFGLPNTDSVKNLSIFFLQ